jgi:hypothetical protein
MSTPHSIRRRLGAGIALFTLLTLIPNQAYADNCSSLSDCYGTILAAVLVAVAIALAIIVIVFLPEILAFAGAEALALSAEVAETLGVGAEIAEGVEAIEAIEAAELAEGVEAVEAAEAAEGSIGAAEESEVTREATVETNFERLARLDDAKGKLPFDPAEIRTPGQGAYDCPECVRAVESRFEGIVNETTQAGDFTEGIINNEDMEYWYGRTFSESSYQSIADDLLAQGPGSRGIVLVNTPGNPGITAHVINVVNVDGQVIFIDAQQGIASSSASDVLANVFTRIRFMVTAP